ncbi:hypothetical protein WICPIJ_007285 [Wickerhamomyces pijperi]|uniref:Uncharacterized protein n=1 Tax=Wickerhamomyces pijperi TaxID=599730 RepID=A0A9P8Q052_WICPI|nr:hypothetical protein WICPIJ_007285 [Wickerhamomyces pijperi]
MTGEVQVGLSYRVVVTAVLITGSKKSENLEVEIFVVRIVCDNVRKLNSGDKVLVTWSHNTGVLELRQISRWGGLVERVRLMLMFNSRRLVACDLLVRVLLWLAWLLLLALLLLELLTHVLLVLLYQLMLQLRRQLSELLRMDLAQVEVHWYVVERHWWRSYEARWIVAKVWLLRKGARWRTLLLLLWWERTLAWELLGSRRGRRHT